MNQTKEQSLLDAMERGFPVYEELATVYRNQQQFEKTIEWLEKGIQNGLAHLWYELGLIYCGYYGNSTIRNEQNGKVAFETALTQNISLEIKGKCAFELYQLLKSVDSTKSFEMLSLAAQYNDWRAQEILGLLNDENDSLEWLEKAYGQLNSANYITSKRRYELARKYYKKQNYQKYCEWLSKSCEGLGQDRQASYELMMVCVRLGISEADLIRYSVTNDISILSQDDPSNW
jgi:tetratricopeptide (TPR) repeat protein